VQVRAESVIILMSDNMEDGDSADCGMGVIVEHVDLDPGPETAGREVEDAVVEVTTSISRETSLSEPD
jgi:hypothetical protein